MYQDFLTFNTLRFVICIFGWFTTFFAQAQNQNIAPNGSFEVYDECPWSFGHGGALQCVPWISGTEASTDYFNVCADISTGVNVPYTFMGYQFAKTGDAFTGTWNLFVDNYREYLQAPLIEYLMPGHTYHVSFWVSNSNYHCGIANFGAYFSFSPPPNSGEGPIQATPQVFNTNGYMTDTSGWMLIMACYEPLGVEGTITIGNFSDSTNTNFDPDCNESDFSYFFIDDVVIVEVPVGGVDALELGPPVIECTSYTINPGLEGVVYAWSNGTFGETLTVTTTGTYAVTATGGCLIQVDSVHVTILGSGDVELPAEDLILCVGDSYVISLDPDAGDYQWNDGTENAEYTITGPGIYTVTLDDGCDITIDQIVVTSLAPPTPFTLGPDEVLCPGEDHIISFDPSLGDFQWQDDNSNATYLITQEGSYALTISNMCGEFSDDLEVIEMESPDPGLPVQPVLLCEDSSATLSLDEFQGDYIWSDGNTSPEYIFNTPGSYFVTVTNPCGIYTGSVDVELVEHLYLDLGPDQYLCPSLFPYQIQSGNIPDADDYLWNDDSTEESLWVEHHGIYSLTVTNACFEATDEIEIYQEIGPPNVVLPIDQLLCEGQSILLSSNYQAATFLWQDGSTGSTFQVQSPGVYYLAVTNDCGTGSDTVVVDYLPSLDAFDLGPDVSICPGQQIILTAGISGAVYHWQDGTTADSLVVTNPGTYTLQVSNQCASLTDSIVVSFNTDSPQVDLPSALSMCQGDAIVLSAGITGVTYHWSDGSHNDQLQISTPGIYSITVSNACGSDADTVVVTDDGAAPTLSLGNDLSFCEGESMLLSPQSTGAINWLWQDGTTQSSILLSTAGQYYASVSNGCGSAQDTMEVSILASTPPLSLGQDTSLCPGEVFILTIPDTGVNILWSDGSTNSSLPVSTSGLFYADITNGCGVSSDTVLVTSLPPAPVLNLGADQSLCVGETILIDPAISNVDFLWQDGSTNSYYQATTEETIILEVSNSCGSDTDTLEIFESTEGPDVDLGNDIAGCAGDTVVLSSSISGVDFAWTDGSTEAILEVTTSGMYSLTVSNLCGSDMDTILVDLSGVAPSVTLNPDTSLCIGQLLTLVVNVPSGAQIMWEDGSTSPTFTVTAEGNYTVNVFNLCGADSDSISVTLQNPPDMFTLGSDTVLCPGESLFLVAPVTSNDILWQNGSQLSSILAEEEGIYTLTISNACGQSTDQLEVAFSHLIPEIQLDDHYPWCNGDQITLNVEQGFPAIYAWSDGSTASSITISTPGNYSISVSTLCQTIQHEFTVESIEPCGTEPDLKTGLAIPNVFSPNDDGINDVFSISFGKDISVIEMTGSIYDRWGNIVFTSDLIPFTWNGRFAGELLNPGVYVYSIQVRYTAGSQEKTEVLNGDVTMIR